MVAEAFGAAVTALVGVIAALNVQLEQLIDQLQRAGTAPVTRASGKRQLVVAWLARNRRLADAGYLWAFSALGASPGARTYYDRCRAAGQSHPQALRALANRLVGILHGCLRHRSPYDEHKAWPAALQDAA